MRKKEFHGKANTRTYRIWCSMINRCHNPNASGWYKYGEKGINVCDEWRGSFVNFLADMGEAPAGMSIERKDGTKGYYKDNCKWADIIEQATNRSTTRMIEYKGRTQSLAQWCRELGVNYFTARTRLDEGRTLDEVFSETKFTTRPKNSARSVIVEFRGKKQTLMQWCRELGVNYATAASRLKRGLPASEVFHVGSLRNLG